MALNRRIAQIYDRDPARYDRMMNRFMDRILVRGRREIGAFAEGRVLEIGVGTGLSLLHYSRVTSVTGIDLSAKMIAVAKRRAAEANLSIELCLMDAQKLAFADQVFDSVVFSLCLCTIPDPEAAIAEAVRVVKPGGRMVFLEHVRSPNPVVAFIEDALNPLTVHFQQDHLNRRTVELIEREGIRIDRLNRWGLGIFVFLAGRAPGGLEAASSLR